MPRRLPAGLAGETQPPEVRLQDEQELLFENRGGWGLVFETPAHAMSPRRLHDVRLQVGQELSIEPRGSWALSRVFNSIVASLTDSHRLRVLECITEIACNAVAAITCPDTLTNSRSPAFISEVELPGVAAADYPLSRRIN